MLVKTPESSLPTGSAARPSRRALLRLGVRRVGDEMEEAVRPGYHPETAVAHGSFGEAEPDRRGASMSDSFRDAILVPVDVRIAVAVLVEHSGGFENKVRA